MLVYYSSISQGTSTSRSNLLSVFLALFSTRKCTFPRDFLFLVPSFTTEKIIFFFLSFTFGFFCNTSDLTSKVEPNGFLISDFPLEIANLSVSWQLCFHRFHKVFSQLKTARKSALMWNECFCHERQLTIFSIKRQN